MSICIIHLSDGKVAGVYSNTHEPMEVMVMERDGPRMTEEQQARYRAFQTMVKYGRVMDWQNPPYPVPCAPEFAPNLLDELLVRPKDGTADRERQRLELSYAMGYLAAQRKLRETLERFTRTGRTVMEEFPSEIRDFFGKYQDDQLKVFLELCAEANGTDAAGRKECVNG